MAYPNLPNFVVGKYAPTPAPLVWYQILVYTLACVRPSNLCIESSATSSALIKDFSVIKNISFIIMLNAWAEQSEKYHNGDINRDEYDKWRYNYPKYDEASDFVKVPSQNFSDAMAEAFKDKLK